MSVTERSNKRMKESGPTGAPPPRLPPDGYGQPASYPPYGLPTAQATAGMWQQGHGHPPPPYSAWGHGSSTGPAPPPPPSMYSHRTGGPPAYSTRAPPPMSGTHRGPPPSRSTGKESDAHDGNGRPPPPTGYQGNYYPPVQPPYSNPYQHGPPPQSPQMQNSSSTAYSNPRPHQQPVNIYGNSPSRSDSNGSCHPRTSPESLDEGGEETYGSTTTTTGTDAPDFSNNRTLFPSCTAEALDDDGNSSVATGSGGGTNSKDKGRGSYKCGRCGVPKKGHVCPYQPKLTRKVGEPLPEMRSAAIQVEMDEFMTLRRLNLKIQGFPESYASEPYGEDMVVGEPQQSSMTSPAPQSRQQQQQQQQHGDVLNDSVADAAIREDPITGAT